MTTVLLQQVVNGVTIGVVYALIAVGLTLVFGILGVINFAHGEFYMLGAFLTYSLTIGLGLDYFVALALTIVGSTAAGWLAERLTVRPLKGRHMFTVVLSTLGLSIFLQNGALLVWGPDPREIELAWGGRPVVLGGVVITFLRLAVLGGIILGVAESLGAGFLPGGASYKDGIGYAILIVVLLYSPQGLFGRGA